MKTVKNRVGTLLKLLGSVPDAESIAPSPVCHTGGKFARSGTGETRRARKLRKREHTKKLEQAKRRSAEKNRWAENRAYYDKTKAECLLDEQLDEIETKLQTATGKELSELRDKAQELSDKNPKSRRARAALYEAAGKIADESRLWTTVTTVTSSPSIGASPRPRRCSDRHKLIRNVG